MWPSVGGQMAHGTYKGFVTGGEGYRKEEVMRENRRNVSTHKKLVCYQ